MKVTIKIVHTLYHLKIFPRIFLFFLLVDHLHLVIHMYQGNLWFTVIMLFVIINVNIFDTPKQLIDLQAE